jgi:hypothetical protein
MDRSHVIFGNKMSSRIIKKSEKNKQKMLKKFGDDRNKTYHLSSAHSPVLEEPFGLQVIHTSDEGGLSLDEKSVIIGNIRMGFGHYRISMAIASCAKHLGYTPYWFDLHQYKETTGGKIISHLNGLYSMGSRWSQKYPLFNKLYWEPLNSEGFKKLSYNSSDQKVAELMTPVFKELPKDVPYLATHVWPAQAAVHAGVKRVVNVIPDNWPMGLHLAEGSIHTVQTPSSYLGYRTLKNMSQQAVNQPMSSEDIAYTGHYVDHELVSNLVADTEKRLERLNSQKPLRFLLTVGGAGAQQAMFISIINKLMPYVKKNQVALFINVGDHKKVWDGLSEKITGLDQQTVKHFDDWNGTKTFCDSAIDGDVTGVHAFYHEDIFAAVYSTNLLMRVSDVLMTKPSELSFYPIPKLLIQRVGGHEAYGAIRASEIGDGTIECENIPLTLQMIELMLSSEEILAQMNQNILEANNNGIYNGGYKAVEIAVNGLN